MKATGIVISTLIVVFWVMAVQTAAQEEMRFVDNSNFPKITKAASVFEHDHHNEISGIEDCTVCHHVYEDGKRLEDESSEDQPCADCHDPGKNGRDLRKVYHQSCKGCHLSRKAGPILCGECHRKRP